MTNEINNASSKQHYLNPSSSTNPARDACNQRIQAMWGSQMPGGQLNYVSQAEAWKKKNIDSGLNWKFDPPAPLSSQQKSKTLFKRAISFFTQNSTSIAPMKPHTSSVLGDSQKFNPIYDSATDDTTQIDAKHPHQDWDELVYETTPRHQKQNDPRFHLYEEIQDHHLPSIPWDTTVYAVDHTTPKTGALHSPGTSPYEAIEDQEPHIYEKIDVTPVKKPTLMQQAVSSVKNMWKKKIPADPKLATPKSSAADSGLNQHGKSLPRDGSSSSFYDLGKSLHVEVNYDNLNTIDLFRN